MYQKIIVIGYLGQDPEQRQAGGTSVCNFSVAAGEKWKNKAGEQQEHTEWFRCVAWGRTGEIANEYLDKGSLVTVEGKMRTEQYEKDGETKYAVKLIVDKLVLMPQPEKRQGGGERQERSDSSGSSGRSDRKDPPKKDEDFDDDIPF